MLHVPDAVSAAYALVERWCQVLDGAQAGVNVYARAEDCHIAFQSQTPVLLDSAATLKLDEALVVIRPRCSALTIEVHQTAGTHSAERSCTLSMPPRATYCLRTQLGSFILLKVSIHGWRSSAGFVSLMHSCLHGRSPTVVSCPCSVDIST
jgi:hypothetical protein